MRFPPALAPGARVAIVAPAGPLGANSELEQAVRNAESFGWEPVLGENVRVRHGYLAGDDAARLRDLDAALLDDSIDGIWCARGGYGAMRLLPALDLSLLATRPRVLLGYSDITALHAAASRVADVVTYHGPTARETLTEFSRGSLERAVVQQVDPCGHAPAAESMRGGRTEGRLVGGNLALLAALCGTPYAPDYSGAILVMEDVGEPTYRIDRMLQQLALAGVFSSVAGLMFGQFTEIVPGGDTSPRSLRDVLSEFADIARVPTITGAPMGHIDEQWTIPLGAQATLDADACTLHVHEH